jgi:protein disulfide-isomerase A1
MEATENDLPPSVPFRISGFPTIKFKPAGTKEFIEYEGDRSYESLKAFVEEHAKNSLEMPIIAQPDEGAQKPLKEKEATNSSGHDEL